MKMLRATAAALLFVSAATAVPALAQSTPFRSGAGGPRQGGSFMAPFRQPVPQDRKPCLNRGRCRGWGLYGYGYGGIGHQDLLAGGRYGYFSQGGDARHLSNGRPTYDYDRGYPYEYYNRGGHADASEAPRTRYARTRDCSTETTRDRRTGREVDIRICRN